MIFTNGKKIHIDEIIETIGRLDLGIVVCL